jgi:hypothetical protein
MDNDPTPMNTRPKRRPPEALEDLSLALREHVVWPVEDWALGLRDRGRTIAVGGAVVVAIALGAGGFVLVSSTDSGFERAPQVAATIVPLEQPVPKPKPAPPEPTLHGAAPVFKPAPDASAVGDSKKVEEAAAKASADNTGSAATDTISATPSADRARGASGASTSSVLVDGPPAGPVAIKVAREFSDAFVDYETGNQKASVRKAFAATATPELRKALLRRPPRQPAGVAVPKAKVLNVVPAPSHGTIYPLSVSLLRVGITSELRLEMERLKNKEWRVINVLG